MGGGGGTTTTHHTGTVDTAYNARMAAIAEEQQSMAREIYSWMWNQGYMDMEGEMIAANRELIPQQTSLAKEQIAAEKTLLPGQVNLAQEGIKTGIAQEGLAQEKTAAQRAMMPEYFGKVQQGLDVRGQMNLASADVTKAFAGADDQLRRDASRMGMSPASSTVLSRLSDTNLERAKAVAATRTGTRTTTEQANLTNLREAMTL